MRIGSLFSGIGGLELGLERAGLGEVVWQAEIDPFCRAVLAKHWPDAVRYSDVKEVGYGANGVDLLCGGFPCQDLSSANTASRAGLGGAKSGLWGEFQRVIRELGPRFVIVENVGRTWADWVPDVRRDLYGLGYSSLPIRLRAADFGAPHDRDRVFVVADSHGNGESVRAIHAQASRMQEDAGRFAEIWREAFAGPVGMDDGVPGSVGEVHAYGNAVMPQMGQVIGTAIARVVEL